MGNLHSSDQRLDTDDRSHADSRHEEVIDTDAPVDLSPVVSDEEESSPERLFRVASANFLFENEETNNAWTLFQNGEPFTESPNVHSGNNNWGGVGWPANDAEDATLQELALATCSFLSSEVTGAILGDNWDDAEDEENVLESSGVACSDYGRSTLGIFFPSCVPPGVMEAPGRDCVEDVQAFYPPVTQHHEWMGRSIETLLLGHVSAAPILALPKEDNSVSPPSPEESTRRTSICSLDMERTPHRAARRTSAADSRRRNSGMHTRSKGASNSGPNVLLSLLAREGTGKPTSLQSIPPTHRLREMGGSSLYDAVDKAAGGIVSEVVLLEDALNRGDWMVTQSVISRLAPRLIGDPTVTSADRARNSIDDPSLSASASNFHAGGGRLGLERDAFVLSGGVKLLLRVFTEPAFVGDELVRSNDARDLSEDTVDRKLVGCWNEVFMSLRELVYAMPVLVENGEVLDGGDFLPFLFTLLAHDSCFDGAAALIEEILSVQSQSLQQLPLPDDAALETAVRSVGYAAPATTFFLGNVPDLYELWGGFNCRQLAHFCRLFALLIFEPEDRQVLESPAVLKSIELLQLRRDRAARAGRDATVDMNQAVLLGDLDLVQKLLKLLRVMNFGPSLTRSTPYQVMSHFPFLGDTLPMVGLMEISVWNEIDRLENLARSMLSQDSENCVKDLGSVTDMLESLSGSLQHNALEPVNQPAQFIQVFNAAQQAGVVVGVPSSGSGQERSHEGVDRSPQAARDASDSLAEAAMTISDQILLRRWQVVGYSIQEGGGDPVIHCVHLSSPITCPKDAANTLQFNAFLLAPFQIEVLFVLCTLLGGRRKLDAQTVLRDGGIIPILDEMFHRLSFRNDSPSQRSADDESTENQDAAPSSASLGASSGPQAQEDPLGIHGSGCECTQESALSVQFLRALHNFCDRDCDNHTDRRLLLSTSERNFVFSGDAVPRDLRPGLLSKVIEAFLSEADDSPYRFWLSSCIESYLRGSCVQEQLFVAKSGLLLHLVEHVTSARLHCAGSLQTSFDLLGEMCKGNLEVLRLLMSQLDETNFHRLMNVAASNLVDSNVFIRALILSVERIAMPQPRNQEANSLGITSSHSLWQNKEGPSTRYYLTHSWWDLVPLHLSTEDIPWPPRRADTCFVNDEQRCDDARPSDWFPPAGLCCFGDNLSAEESPTFASGSHISATTGHCGWGSSRESHANTIESLCWFDINRGRLVRDLLGVVDLTNINHENICCLNTAIVLVIIAHRHNTLHQLLQEFKRIGGEDSPERQNNDRRDSDGAFTEAMRSLAIDGDHPLESLEPVQKLSVARKDGDKAQNFRELIWFWKEYYSHRGRDRLSLEFSSHLRFQEWKNAVSVLGADDGSSTSLLPKPVHLPRSPYLRAPRVLDLESHLRGA